MPDTRDPAEVLAAARQGSIVLAATAVFAPFAILSSSHPPGWSIALSATSLIAAAVCWVLPWNNWPPRRTALIGFAAIALVSMSAYLFDGYAAGVGPMFVLVFAWFGLHHSARVILLALPVAAAGYVAALIAADARTRLVLSALVLFPIAVVVSLAINRTVRDLRATRTQLRLKDRWRAALMATLAHDVRSPLTSVLGVLELLEEDIEGEQYQHLLRSATRQSHRMVRLAQGILEVERVEQGKLRLDREHLSLREVALEVSDLTDPERVVVNVHHDVRVWADRPRLEQILFNLTNNALRHGEPPVTISSREAVNPQASTSTAASPAMIEILVSDQGTGVPAADVAGLFDRFSSSDRSPQSVGLGLWIVYTLVDSHGGTVHYEAANPGARFVVRIPNTPPSSRTPDLSPYAGLRPT